MNGIEDAARRADPDAVIDAAYRAAESMHGDGADASGWQAVLASLAALTGADAIELCCADPLGDAPHWSVAHPHAGLDWVIAITSPFAETLGGEKAFKASWVEPAGEGSSSLCIRLADVPNGAFFLALTVPSAERGGLVATLADEIGVLNHLARALKLWSALLRQGARSDILTGVAERLLVGICIMDENGRIVLANAAARRILEKRDGIYQEDAHLRFHTHEADRRLAALLRRTKPAVIGSAENEMGELSIARPSGAADFRVLMLASRDDMPVAANGGLAGLVIMSDPEERAAIDKKCLGRMFNLTESESRLVSALVDGETLTTFAEAMGMSLHTARWHLKNVFAKTGAHNQADLVRMVLKSPVVMEAAPS